MNYIKNDLAELKKEIVEAKRIRKLARASGEMSEAHYNVRKLKESFRLKHVVYCLLKGKNHLLKLY